MPFAQSADSVLQALGSDVKQGLGSEQVTRRRTEFGFNELETVPPEPLWRKFLRQFSDAVVWLLIVAAITSRCFPSETAKRAGKSSVIPRKAMSIVVADPAVVTVDRVVGRDQSVDELRRRQQIHHRRGATGGRGRRARASSR